MASLDRALVMAVTAAVKHRKAETHGAELRFLCPAHTDSKPSADWNEEKATWICRACAVGGGAVDLARRLGIEVGRVASKSNGVKAPLPPAQRAQSSGARDAASDRGGTGEGVHPPSESPATLQAGVTVAALAESKRLPVDYLRSRGLSDITYQSAPAVRIPYLDKNGAESAVRFRLSIKTEPRFKWKSGARPSLYGLDRLKDATAYVVCVEGESDQWVGDFHGLPTVGVPGASNFKEDRDAPHLADFAEIDVIVEPDQGGESLVAALSKSSLRDRVHLVRLEGFKDLADLHVDDPDRFLDRWEAARAAAIPLRDELKKALRERREQAARDAAELIHTPDILARFTTDIRRRGLVGEERSARITYLVTTTRVLDRPTSEVVKGVSSAGKSFVVEETLKFFPESAYYALSGMSEHALAYGTEPLSHRVLVLYEAAGMGGDFATYLLRSLLSEGRVRYETVVKTSEGMEPRLIEREGPTGLIVTTTALSLHPENETRMLTVPISDTAEQTAAVLRALAADSSEPVDFAAWHALQEWIATGPNKVAIPFAPQLASMIPAVAVRLRRDFGAILNLIRAHAVLHQATRELGEDGRIVATVADYAAVHSLVADLVSDQIGATVPATMRETVDTVASLTGDDGETTFSAVAKQLKLDLSAGQRRVRSAISKGYVRNLEDRRGRPARLVLGDPLPGDIELLPTPERLQPCSAPAVGKKPPPPSLEDVQCPFCVEPLPSGVSACPNCLEFLDATTPGEPQFEEVRLDR